MFAKLPGYRTLLVLVLPVFAVIAAGAGARRLGWLKPEADESLLKLDLHGQHRRPGAFADPPCSSPWPYLRESIAPAT